MDHAEEQEMEIEALESIFDTDFKSISTAPHEFELTLVPNPGEDDENHVGLKVRVTFPAKYPEEAPNVVLSSLKGLKPAQVKLLKGMVDETVSEYMGDVMVFTITEALKDYLLDNNTKEATLYEQMMEKVEADEAFVQAAKDEEEAKQQQQEEEAATAFSNPLGIDASTLVTADTFANWLTRFTLEQQGAAEVVDDKAPMTGRQIFEANLARELDDGGDDKAKSPDEVFCFDESLYDDDDAELLDDDDDDEDDDDEDEDDEDDTKDDAAPEEPSVEEKLEKVTIAPQESQAAGKKKRRNRKK